MSLIIIEAVKLSHNSDKNVEEVAESLGISESTLHRWRSEFRDYPEQPFPSKGYLNPVAYEQLPLVA